MTPPSTGRPVAAVILAAGKSTRMRSRVPKPLHPICGRKLTRHVVEACREAGVGRIVVVVGFEAKAVKAGLGDDLEYAIQYEQRGSGDAAQAASHALRGFDGDVLVLAGDVPLLRASTLRRLIDAHRSGGALATLLTAVQEDATGYGRIVRGDDGGVERIVEEKDCTAEQRAIREWNPSVYCFDGAALFDSLAELRPDNAQGELLLTDTVSILRRRGARVAAEPMDDAGEAMGVNTRVELAEAARILRGRILRDLMLSGVSITDPASTYVDAGVRVGQDTLIEPNSFLCGRTVIGAGCTVGPSTRIADCTVGDGARILASQVVESDIGPEVKIGPYANIRPGCRLAAGARVGDFVELKNSTLGERVSASHLAYLGDADVGARTNIGAGVITCNFDGKHKHRTIIGNDAFIGTHATLVAPVSIGDGAFIAAASAITDDVPADALAIARSRQTIKPEWARRRKEG